MFFAFLTIIVLANAFTVWAVIYAPQQEDNEEEIRLEDEDNG